MTREHDLTGNDYISIASISADGGLDGIGVLHGELAGLVEWCGPEGTPLLRPTVSIDDERVDISAARWRRLDRWIPSFTATAADGSTVTGTICAPGGYPSARGFLVRLEVEARGREPRRVRVELAVHRAPTRLWIASPRPMPGRDHIAVDPDVQMLVLSTDDGRGPALAIAASRPADMTVSPSGNDGPGEARVSVTFELRHGQRDGIAFLVGAGRERDGAVAAARALRRTGADRWLRQARLELSHTLRSAEDHRWAELLNRNLLFNRYFAVGRGIDDDRLYLVRSRSSRCPEPAIFNDREALLWTVPALIVADPAVAREAIMRVLETFSERSGEHRRYLDGGSYDGGFLLEQFLLYPWIVDHYVERTGDATLLEEPLVQQIVLETDTGAYMRLHPEHLLGSTDLLPSGEPADYPFATMPNVLLHAFAAALARLPWSAPDQPRLGGAASDIAATVWQHCTSTVNGEPLLASSVDLEGRSAVYDDPALSFAMLPFFGFCTPDEPVWLSTMEFLRSERYPLWRDGTVPGLAGRSDNALARLSALCADLLGPAPRDALDRLLRLRLPAGLAAGAYDPADGSTTQPHDAALAGFLAWTLVRAAEPPRPPNKPRRGRR
jgi:uncharacterized protein